MSNVIAKPSIIAMYPYVPPSFCLAQSSSDSKTRITYNGYENNKTTSSGPRQDKTTDANWPNWEKVTV